MQSFRIRLHLLMPVYDFHNLSPIDFEEVSRDLLQLALQVRLESFGPGPDKGIDFRYSRDASNEIVVQCKHYRSWQSLFQNLKREAKKVPRLDPKRYVLTTSQSLTDAKKDKISGEFSPFIQNKADIFGLEDLNNLIGQFPTVLRNHPKLWLASAHVLQLLLSSRVNNQTLFEREKIQRALTIFVENESFGKAIRILNERRYVIISGIPGIGKSTLARMLVAAYLYAGFEEFVAVSESINDAYDLYDEDKKQIFFFDDFLGTVFLGHQLSTNEDKRLARLLERVSNSKNKLFILTTREHILSQAKEEFDALNNKGLDLSKCVLSLQDYTRRNRARILYNHLYYSTISRAHLEDLLQDKRYLKIIDHRNYSPRIVEELVSIDDIWKGIQPNEFANSFVHFLDNPVLIWKRVYESHISRFSQCLLTNMISTGGPILYDDLQQIMRSFAERHAAKYGIRYSQFDFTKSIRELQNSFIIVNRSRSGERLVVTFTNPSVEDFLIGYLSSNPDLISDILSTAPFFNQFFSIFSFRKSSFTTFRGSSDTIRAITLSEGVRSLVVSRLRNEYRQMNVSTLHSAEGANRKDESIFARLEQMVYEFEGKDEETFLKEEFESVNDPTLLTTDEDLRIFPGLVDVIEDDRFVHDTETVSKFFRQIYSLNQLEYFENFERAQPYAFKNFVDDNSEFKEKVRELISEEIEGYPSDELEYLSERVGEIESKYGIYVDDLQDEITTQINESHANAPVDYEVFIPDQQTPKLHSDNDLNEITAMFDSLTSLRDDTT